MTRNILARIIKDESGATAIEYGLIVALIAVAAIRRLPRWAANLTGLLRLAVAGKLTRHARAAASSETQPSSDTFG